MSSVEPVSRKTRNVGYGPLRSNYATDIKKYTLEGNNKTIKPPCAHNKEQAGRRVLPSTRRALNLDTCSCRHCSSRAGPVAVLRRALSISYPHGYYLQNTTTVEMDPGMRWRRFGLVGGAGLTAAVEIGRAGQKARPVRMHQTVCGGDGGGRKRPNQLDSGPVAHSRSRSRSTPAAPKPKEKP
jgi:hypothetical protein